MLLSRKWLNEFVEVDASDRDFAEAMTLSGSKQEVTTDLGAGTKNVVVGKIVEMKKHDLYFRTLRALPPSAPQPPLDGAVRRVFGSTDGLKTALKSAALSVFGSGWACLCTDKDGNLSIQKVANQDTVLPLTPLLCCDVWEHAYYLQYQNRRGDYFDAWWRLIDWPQVSERYARILQSHPPIP